MIEELKQRARAGDLRAVQELRDRGFFGTAAARRTHALSRAQRRMWILAQDPAAGAAYHMPRAVVITGVLDRQALTTAFTSLIGRHESLRTTFVRVNDEPRQIVHATLPFEVASQDLRDRPDPMAAALAVAADDAPRPFDLENGPLLRAHLLQLADTEHVLLFNIHHIVCDAWSIDVLVRDLMAFYRGSAPAALRIQYKDYARWHDQRLGSKDATAQRERCLERLSPPPEPLDLPTDRPRAQSSDWLGQTLTVDLGHELRQQVGAAASAHRTGLLTVLVTAVKALLHLESGARDIVVGSPVAGRNHPDLEPLVGMFANAVALRDRVAPEMSFAELLTRVRLTVEAAFEAQEIPFDDLVAALAIEPDPARTPLFDVLVGLLNTERSALRLDDLTVTELEAGTGRTPHDLVFYFVGSDDSLHLALLYRAALFDRDTIVRLVARLTRVLECGMTRADAPLAELLNDPPALRTPQQHTDSTRQVAEIPGVADVAVVSDGLDGRLACVVARHPHDHERLHDTVMALGQDQLRYVAMASLPLLPDGTLHVRRLERLAQDALARRRPASTIGRLHAWDLIPPAGPTRAQPALAPAPSEPDRDVAQTGRPAIVNGGALAGFDRAPWTLGDALIRAAQQTSDARLTFVAADGTEERLGYPQLLEEARRVLSGLRAHGLVRGSRVVLLLPEPRDVLPAFWACVLGGFTPVVAAVPTDFAGITRPAEHLAHLWNLLERPLVVTTEALTPGVASLSRLFDVTPDRPVSLAALRTHDPAMDLAQGSPDDVAFFSLTSGSTGAPKCVMLTHRNALARARGTNVQCGHARTDIVLNWLPFDHIGSLSDWHLRCVEVACSAVYVAKELVLGDPLQWLALLDRHRVTHSWAPNFAYSLVTSAVDAARSKRHRPTWDLSSVRMLLTAGEAVTPAAVDAFQARLSPHGLVEGAIRPAFGMAEMASGVTYGHAGATPQPARFFRIDRRSLAGVLQDSDDRAAAAFADLGPPIPGTSLRIVSDAGAVLGERQVGRLHVKGAPVSRGYYRDEAATRAAFLEDGWFDTGDFGFLADGHLALTGRAKEGIIVSGANYASAEIESIVETVDGVAVSFAAAAAVRGPGDDDERLAVFFAPREGSQRPLGDVARDIREAIVQRIGITAEYIVRVRPEEISKTAIGKIQRKPLVARFEAGGYAGAVRSTDLAVASARTIPHWFARREWRRAEARAVRALPASAAVLGPSDETALHVSERLASAGVATPDLDAAEAAVLIQGTASRNLHELLDVVRRLERRGERPLRLLVVTRGAQIVLDRDSTHEDRAAWSGLVATLAQEMPWIDATVIDVDDGAEIVSVIEAELRSASAVLTAWRGGARYEARIVQDGRLQQPPGATPFEAGSLYLIAGGAGGIGLRLAAYLRERHQLRLLIVGQRSTEEVAEAINVVGDSAAVLYRSADITDPRALSAAVTEAEAAFGTRLAGVVDLAGIASERALVDESAESIASVMAPKAAGVRALAALAEERCGQDGVFVAFSSVNGLLGGARAGAYAAANAQLDAITDEIRRRGRLRCWTIAWSMWEDTGMSRGFEWREATRARGFYTLRPTDALLSLEAVLRRAPAAVLVGVEDANAYVARWNPEGHALVGERSDAPGHVPPTSETERRIARIWEQLLGVADIGIHDHFVRLGGHSLKATQLVAALQQEFGAAVTLHDLFTAPTIAGLAAAIDGAGRPALESIPTLDEAPHYAVSHAQRRLWVLERMGLAGTAYTIASATRLTGDLDRPALASAFERVSCRHESLRTTFAEIDGEPRQIVHPDPLARVEWVDASGAPDVEDEVRRRIDAAIAEPFDLEGGPLVRMTLYATAPGAAVLLVSLHHSICDGLSMEVLVTELLASYDAARRRETVPLSPPRVQYRDFAAWQNARIADAGTARAYWLKALEGELPALDLPADRPRPTVQTSAGATSEIEIGADVGRALRALAKARGATMFAVWLAVARALIFRYVRATDAIIGTPVAGRDHPELAEVVGFFVNMLPLRLAADGLMTAADLIDRAAAVTTGALTHQLYPYDLLVDDLQTPRHAGRNPLFDVAISVHEHQPDTAPSVGLTRAPFSLGARTSKFDVTFFLVEGADGTWQLTIEYATDLYDAGRATRMATHFVTLAGSVGRRPSASLRDLELLPTDERQAVLRRFPFESSTYPRDRSIVSLFDEQCQRRPDAVAVRATTGTLTYAELRARASEVARRLRSRVGPGDVVGVRMDRSEDVPVALLGILAAGAAYLPLDPSLPEARLAAIVDDAQCKVVLSDLTALDRLEAHALIGAAEAPAATSLAYVIYTSGSTGKPKGTLIEHRSVVRLVKDTNSLQIGPDDRVLQAGSLAFDASTFEIWGPLLNGGCLCLADRSDLLEPQALASVIDRWQITAMFCTSGLFNQMIEADPLVFAGLQHLIFGGERVSVPHVAQLRAALPSLHLVHAYGPTENTTFTTCHHVDRVGDAVPLGRPVANTSVFVLDPDQRPSPIGVPGEIYAGGDGLARGYLNDAALTAARFVPNPYRPGERLYRTGDAGVWLESGHLEFVGRLDEQVKVRGYRIEPGEIGIAMQAVAGVRDAIVTTRRTSAGTLELIGYYVGDEMPASRLREALAITLPDYMIPALFVHLDRFPLNQNGKVDRVRLPDPGTAAAPVVAAPRGEREALLLDVLAPLLGGAAIGVDDNYFDLGGDSIRAIQLASRVRARGWTMRVRDVFDSPRLSDLATKLAPLTASSTPQRMRARVGPVPLLPAQHWFFARHTGALHHFNQSVLLKPAMPLERDGLATALRALVQQHDALRLVCPEGRAEIRPAIDLSFDEIDLSAADAPLTVLQEQLDARHRDLDLAGGPLFRAALVHLPGGEQRLWLAAHHLCVDGVSWRIIVADLAMAYRQAAAGQPVDLGMATASFADRGDEIARVLASDALADESDYWRHIEEQTPAEGEPHGTYDAVETFSSNISETVMRDIIASAHQAYGTTAHELMLAALGWACRDVFGTSESLVTLEGHGRQALEEEDLDLTRTVGWFTAIYPAVLPAFDEPRDQIRQVKDSQRRLPRNGIGYGIRQMSGRHGAESARRTPLVSFNYLGQVDGSDPSDLFQLAPEPSGAGFGAVARAHAIDIVVMGSNGGLHVTVAAPEQWRARAQRLLDAFVVHLASLASHCVGRADEPTLADLTSPPDTLERFDDLLAARGWRAAEIADVCRPIGSQSSLVALSLIDPSSRAYHVQMAYTVSGALQPEAFERAWATVCDRHPMLRSAFAHKGLDAPTRVVFRAARPDIAWHDLRGLDAIARRDAMGRLRDEDLARGFDFERPPLMRLTVVRLADPTWEVLWSYHHAILDGWSLGVVFTDFADAYDAAVSGKVLPASTPSDPAALIRWTDAQSRDATLTWWAEYLKECDETLLPSERRPAIARDEREIVVEIDEEYTRRLGRAAAGWGVTMAVLVQAAWARVLARYAGHDDIVFGTIVSGRPAAVAGAERMVGALINAVPVRTAVAVDASLESIARRLQQDAIAAESHQWLPLAEIQEASALGRDLISHLVVIENYPVEQRLADASRATSLSIDGVDAHDRTHYTFTLNVVPAERLRMRFQYDAAVHPPELIQQIARDYEAVLTERALSVERPLVSPPLSPACATVIDAFAAQAAAHPSRLALVDDHGEVSYAQLANEAHAIAEDLRGNGIADGDVVAVRMNRGRRLPAALLGVLEAGAAYLPIDPSYPPSRVALMLEDSGCAAMLTDDGLERCGWRAHVPGAAYVIYTSGSTGTPKGVVISHAALSNQIAWLVQEFGIRPDDRMLQKTSIAFDASVWEFFAPLAAGAAIVIAPPLAHRDPQQLAQALDEHRVTLLQLVPSQLAMLQEAGWHPTRTTLRMLFLGGEAVDPSLLARLPRPAPFEVINLYGPTETCINATFWRWDGRVDGPIPIGSPTGGTAVVILDRHRQPAPRGAIGEIGIAGANLAIGYHQRRDLTDERFVDVAALGTRVYLTGDLGRRTWREDLVEFCGRADHQVKIRGHRIECGEVEAALRAQPGVHDACVVARKDGLSADLVAFVVAPGVSADALRASLAATVPAAAVPSAIVGLDALPTAPGGKVDRRALERSSTTVALGRSDVVGAAPRTALEEALARIWSGVLGRAAVGVDESFFDAGGHSLKAMQMVSRIGRDLGVRVSIADVFAHPTIAQLARVAGAAGSQESRAIPVAPPREHYALSHAQRRLWLLHHFPGGETAYNMPFALRLDGAGLDVSALESAFAALAARHEALRTTFVVVDGDPRQHVHERVVVPIRQVDLRAATDALAEARALAIADAHEPFDLTRAPLLRVTIVHLEDARAVLLLTMHHIIGDGWSAQVLSREIAVLYQAARSRTTAALPPLRVQYKDYSAWEAHFDVDAHDAWWGDILADANDRIALPYDATTSDHRAFTGAIAEHTVEAETTSSLRALASTKGVTLAHTVLSIFMLALSRISGQQDLVVGMSVANRSHPDLEALIGFFVNVLPIRVQLTRDQDLEGLIVEVSRLATAAMERQDYPFDRLVERLNPRRAGTDQPLVNVVYAFQNFTDVTLDVDAALDGATESHLRISTFDIEFRTSKFDLTLFVTDERDTLRLTLEYDAARFTTATASRYLSIVARFLTVAAGSHGAST